MVRAVLIPHNRHVIAAGIGGAEVYECVEGGRGSGSGCSFWFVYLVSSLGSLFGRFSVNCASLDFHM